MWTTRIDVHLTDDQGKDYIGTVKAEMCKLSGDNLSTVAEVVHRLLTEVAARVPSVVDNLQVVHSVVTRFPQNPTQASDAGNADPSNVP